MSLLMHRATRPEEGQYNIVGHGRAGHRIRESHQFLSFLLPLLGTALKTVAVSAVTQLATNAVSNFVSNAAGGSDAPTAGVQETGLPVPTFEEVAGGSAYAEPPAGVPFAGEAATDFFEEPLVSEPYGIDAATAEGVPPAGLPTGASQSPVSPTIATVSPFTHQVPVITPLERFYMERESRDRGLF